MIKTIGQKTFIVAVVLLLISFGWFFNDWITTSPKEVIEAGAKQISYESERQILKRQPLPAPLTLDEVSTKDRDRAEIAIAVNADVAPHFFASGYFLVEAFEADITNDGSVEMVVNFVTGDSDKRQGGAVVKNDEIIFLYDVTQVTDEDEKRLFTEGWLSVDAFADIYVHGDEKKFWFHFSDGEFVFCDRSPGIPIGAGMKSCYLNRERKIDSVIESTYTSIINRLTSQANEEMGLEYSSRLSEINYLLDGLKRRHDTFFEYMTADCDIQSAQMYGGSAQGGISSSCQTGMKRSYLDDLLWFECWFLSGSKEGCELIYNKD